MKIVRLTTGDEVICNVEETENSVAISDAFSMVATEPGKIGFIPFMAYAKDEQFVIDKQFVVMIVDPITPMSRLSDDGYEFQKDGTLSVMSSTRD